MKKVLGLVLGAAAFAFMGWDFSHFVEEIQKLPKASETPVEAMAVLTGGKGRLHEALSDFSRGQGRYLLISGVAENAGFDDIVRANGGPSLTDDQKVRVI